MLITAVGLPLLGIIALGVSRSSGLMQMSGRVSGWYSYFFTCALYLTIGPLFAIPRCAATSFYNGYSAAYIRHRNTYTGSVYDAVLCAGTVFALRPSKIMDSVGKYLNPVFLICLGILVVAALINPGSRAFHRFL